MSIWQASPWDTVELASVICTARIQQQATAHERYRKLRMRAEFPGRLIGAEGISTFGQTCHSNCQSMDIQLLESSFEKIAPQAIAFSASFYETLFQHHPELAPMFEEVSQEAQEKKLVFSIAAIVENLRNPDVLAPALKSLGARHSQVGTLKQHYPMVGQALIETFAQYLGASWTPETANAWLEAYESIADTMLDGTKNPEQHLEPELTFYEWIDLFGEESPQVKATIQNLTDFHYRLS